MRIGILALILITVKIVAVVMGRHPERDKIRKQAVSITLDHNDIAFIDQGINFRMFQNRSHAVAWALQLLKHHVANITRLQQEGARRLEEVARRGNPNSSGFPQPGPMPPEGNFGPPPH